MALRAAYILIALVVLTTMAVAAFILMDHPWADSAPAVSEQAAPEQAVAFRGPVEQAGTAQPAAEQAETQPEPAQQAAEPPMGAEGASPATSSAKPNTDTKGDRLMAPTPPPADASQIGPPSLSLESARQYLAAPLAGVKFRPVMRSRLLPLLLDDKQIASIKQRLKLSAAQEKYWPPVESALRDLVLYMHNQRTQPISKVLDPSNDQVKRMMTVGMPFLAQLREDQKSQIQSLARMAGLGSELPGLKAAQN